MRILNFFKRIFMSEDNKIVDGAKDVDNFIIFAHKYPLKKI